MEKNKLGIIGTGVMGQAILSCAVRQSFLQPENVFLFDVDRYKARAVGSGYTVATSAQQVIDRSDFVLFAVKPQHFPALAESIRVPETTQVISIMAGVPTNKIRTLLRCTSGIARIMPNTPCKIGLGTCAICFSEMEENKKAFVKQLFATCGTVVPIDETLFDAVTGVSGSGPAYVYMFLQGMIEGGLRGGLSEEQSKQLAIGTLIGAAKLAECSSEDLSTLIDRVCSKGGTTIEAVQYYREMNLTNIIAAGIDACRIKSEELGKRA